MITDLQNKLREMSQRQTDLLRGIQTTEFLVPHPVQSIDSLCKANNQLSSQVQALIGYAVTLELRIKELENR